MTGIPTTGTNLWSVTDVYPWSGDPSFTDAWIADSRYLDSTGSVGTVLPQKGVISATQGTGANKPTYSAAWGSSNHGMLTGDGVNDHLIVDALAAKVTGLQPFTIITAFQAITVASFKDVWAFSRTSDTASGHSLQLGGEVGTPWVAGMQDDGGVIYRGVSSVLGSTSRLVISLSFNGVSTWMMRINGVNQTVAHLGTPPTTLTLSKFTILGFRGATLSACVNANFRALIFGATPSVASIAAVENYLIAEAA